MCLSFDTSPFLMYRALDLLFLSRWRCSNLFIFMEFLFCFRLQVRKLSLPFMRYPGFFLLLLGLFELINQNK